jgi:hypothetical protein
MSKSKYIYISIGDGINHGDIETKRAQAMRRELAALRREVKRLGPQQALALDAEHRAIGREATRLSKAIDRTDDIDELICIVERCDAMAARAIAIRIHSEKMARRMMRFG